MASENMEMRGRNGTKAMATGSLVDLDGAKSKDLTLMSQMGKRQQLNVRMDEASTKQSGTNDLIEELWISVHDSILIDLTRDVGGIGKVWQLQQSTRRRLTHFWSARFKLAC
jgi:hypothetical protein